MGYKKSESVGQQKSALTESGRVSWWGERKKPRQKLGQYTSNLKMNWLSARTVENT